MSWWAMPDEPRSESLVERLRYYADRDDHEWGPSPVSRTMREAAVRIEELEAADG